jgi:hypothetical protein
VQFGLPCDATIYKLLTDLGSFIGGFLALGAGLLAYCAGLKQARATRAAADAQIETEQKKAERELDTFRKSLAIELRLLVERAMRAHDLLKELSEGDEAITGWMIEGHSRIPAAVVYPGNAEKIGLLGSEEAMQVVIVYNLLETARGAAAQLTKHRTPDKISPDMVASVANAFLQTCKRAAIVLPRLKTGVTGDDDADATLLREIAKREPKFERKFEWGIPSD